MKSVFSNLSKSSRGLKKSNFSRSITKEIRCQHWVLKITEPERLTNTKKAGVGERNRKDERQNILAEAYHPARTTVLLPHGSPITYTSPAAEAEEVTYLFSGRHNLCYCYDNKATVMEEGKHFVSAKSRGKVREAEREEANSMTGVWLERWGEEFRLSFSGCEIQRYCLAVRQKLWIFSYIRKYRERIETISVQGEC